MKLAKQEDGSLFDLRRDSADDIATVITGNISEQQGQGHRGCHRGAVEGEATQASGVARMLSTWWWRRSWRRSAG